MTEGAAAPEEQAADLRNASAADVVERVVANLERAVRAPHEGESCLRRLAAIIATL